MFDLALNSLLKIKTPERGLEEEKVPLVQVLAHLPW